MPSGIFSPAGGSCEAGQQRVDVVRPAFLVLREEVEDGQTGRARRARALAISDMSGGAAPPLAAAAACVVRERAREMVGRPCRAARTCRRRRSGRRCTLYVAASALTCSAVKPGRLVRQDCGTPQLHRMAGRADFLVDLEAALQLRRVVGAERAGEGPALLLRLLDREMRRLLGALPARAQADKRQPARPSAIGEAEDGTCIDVIASALASRGRGAPCSRRTLAQAPLR